MENSCNAALQSGQNTISLKAAYNVYNLCVMMPKNAVYGGSSLGFEIRLVYTK